MQKFIVRYALRTTLMSLVIVLVSGGLIPHASMRDAVMGIERSQQPDTANHDDRAHEFSDATIVVRWSQLAQDNAFAVDPAMTDPFPNARGWTMMYGHARRAQRDRAQVSASTRSSAPTSPPTRSPQRRRRPATS